ncbi:helix-turn-helix domain-containing protein [Actinotalea sp. M2MS4P-6]|uniref:helix-turn-helix domain-containing protein n=1 Tax=Actinotalea sp. M2MS4P-6 TaxID=2983762 RepID=UPI0021E393CE|nr:helix-turn-helix domain-containing protein [Actinotalea sp. M2MS4P-6]MCV2393710.1 helix-turn-helix domain-containing protein [Actinotalea sp. M2MS4P-6]
MTPKEVAERLGISEWWVREQIRRGRVPHLRFGRHRIALLPEHVDAIIELVTVEPAGWQGDGQAGGGASGSARGASGPSESASGKAGAASGSPSGDLTSLRPTGRSARAHRRRPHVQGDCPS